MEMVIGGIAFALLITAQFFAVVVVHNARSASADEPLETRADARVRQIWLCGN